MKRQLNTVGTVHMIHGFFMALFGLAFLLGAVGFALAAASPVAGKAKEFTTGAWSGAAAFFGVALVFGGLAWLDFAIGRGLQNLKGWTRTAAFVRCAFHMFWGPTGWLITAWTVAVLTDEEVQAMFQERSSRRVAAPQPAPALVVAASARTA